MVTYFLQKKKSDDDGLQHQASKTTAASSDCEIVEEEEVELPTNADSERLTQKRKSLCRQHHIFSSLNNTEGAISLDSDDSDNLIDPNGPLDFQTSEKLNLISDNTKPNVISNHIVCPEIHGKNLRHDIKQNLSLNCNPLMDSIESLQKLLKNDVSLSELTSKNLISNKISLESNESMGMSSRVVNNLASDISKMNVEEDESITSPLLPSPADNYSLEPMEKESNKCSKFTCRKPLKLSKSFYLITKKQYNSPKIPNSKSMCVISMHN